MYNKFWQKVVQISIFFPLLKASAKFWQDIKEMGGTALGFIGDCEVEYSPKLNLNDFRKVESR